jgi:hypothetical protein
MSLISVFLKSRRWIDCRAAGGIDGVGDGRLIEEESGILPF